jgi:DNA-binding LacI/PurR family transcriptional regulator
MKNTQATIRDLALKLNISISTVSRALRGAQDVNPDTKKAVLELAKELNYEPNKVAQSLRIKKTNTIGVIVPEIAIHFFSSVISGIQHYTAKHGYSIMICQSLESYETEKANIHMLVGNRVDGLMISLSSQTREFQHLEQLIAKKIPIVLFDRVVDSLPVPKVVVDDHDGAFKAVNHLIKTGCRRIAYIGGDMNLSISNQRRKGYEDALRSNNIPIHSELIVVCEEFHDEPLIATQKLLDLPERPDAIFCMNDPVAILAIQVLKQRKVAIPDEISVVGFTNEPVSRYIEPSITTVAQPAYQMGESAACLFIEQLENPETYRPRMETLQTELIIRNSTRRA